MAEPTREEIAWAAGIFEGEGAIVWVRKTSVRLIIQMADRDVLERFQEIVGVGTLRPNKPRRAALPQWRPQFTWSLQTSSDVDRLLRLFLPWFQSRRGEKARASLLRLEGNRGRPGDRSHCVNGHPLSGDNVYRWAQKPGDRKCRTCRRENNRRHFARLKEST